MTEKEYVLKSRQLNVKKSEAELEKAFKLLETERTRLIANVESELAKLRADVESAKCELQRDKYSVELAQSEIERGV